jgi:hypothetical protein
VVYFLVGCEFDGDVFPVIFGCCNLGDDVGGGVLAELYKILVDLNDDVFLFGLYLVKPFECPAVFCWFI